VSARTRWVLAIVGLLVMNVLAMVLLTVFAHSAGESTVVPAYRERGVR
jgi:hypothetical protein